MAGLPNYQLNLTVSPFQVVIPGFAIGSSVARAGKINIPSGTDTVQVSFVTALTSTSYAVQATLVNTNDSFPEFLPIMVTAFTINGLTFKVNGTTDTSNYYIHWALFGVING